MYSIDYTKRFNKDLKRCMKRGLDLQQLYDAIALLRTTGTLPSVPSPPRSWPPRVATAPSASPSGSAPVKA